MMEWKDIESAPRDGTAMLLACPYNGRVCFYIGGWHLGLNIWAKGFFMTKIFPDHMQGWFSHWMPLPPPPKEQPHD